MWIVLMVVFFLVALVAYGAGVRRGAAWGKPVLALSVLLLILIVLDRAVLHVVSGGPERAGLPEATEAARAGRLMGEALAGRLEEGGRVLVVGIAGPEGAVQVAEGGGGLEKALGERAGEVVRHMCPPFAPESSVAQVAAERGPFAAVVFFSPPGENELAALADTVDGPTAAYFASEAQVDTVRTWLQDGLLSVAVIKTAQGLQTFTSDNLP